MLETEKLNEITQVVNGSLDYAEKVWDRFRPRLTEKMAVAATRMDSVPTDIPGYEYLDWEKPDVSEFVALVVDMRGSSKHLMCNIAEAEVSEFQRIFYETSALLPAMAKTIGYFGGRTTEFLGDGLLALFDASGLKTKDFGSLYSSRNAAKGCLHALDSVVNPILRNRYRLPSLRIGIGMGYSEAIVTLVGTKERPQAKAFGKCVFWASKLSKGENKVICDERMENYWPTTKGGFKFEKVSMGGIDGYVMP